MATYCRSKKCPDICNRGLRQPLRGLLNSDRRANGEKDALRNRTDPIKQPRNAGYILKTFERLETAISRGLVREIISTLSQSHGEIISTPTATKCNLNSYTTLWSCRVLLNAPPIWNEIKRFFGVYGKGFTLVGSSPATPLKSIY